jgi:hypothetical protein
VKSFDQESGGCNMSKNAKIAYVSLISLVGLILFLVGIFTPAYGLFTGLIIGIACWVGSGILARYWEIKK